MKKKRLKKKLQTLELRFDTLQKKYTKLESDRLTIYNLLYRVNKELDEALVNKQTFIASMSHELRSPLTVILGNSALLGETGLTEKQTKYLTQLNDSADFLMALLSDILDVSKLRESKIKLNVQETHLDKLLLHCASMVETKIAKEVEFVVEVPSIPYYVFVDKKRVQQIFVNLLTNAAKFTKRGKIQFILSSINQVDNQLEIVVEILDTGIGIPEKIKETLFEPFTSTDIEEGTGLGLYISYELATLMGGDIIVESREGECSCFKVTFFCEKSVMKMKNLTTNSYIVKEKNRINYKYLKVLIVEDIKINREFLIEMFLVFFSINVETAENGQVAVEKVKNSTYDIVFMDMRMPVLNGIEATKEIRTFNKELPIICMSANVYREDKHEAQVSGMNDFIEKPLEYTDIESRLDKLHKPLSLTFPNNNNQLRQIALNHLLAHFDEETSLRFIKLAEESLETVLKKIEANFLMKEFSPLRENFHAIKGILANLGFQELSIDAEKLESYSKRKEYMNIEEEISLFIFNVKEFFN